MISSLSAVNIVFIQSTENKIRNSLTVAKRVFTRLIEIQTQRLLENTHILSSDFGFKQVIATKDRQTILSALNNLLLRTGADTAVLVSLQHQVIADTAHSNQTNPFFAPELIGQAEQQGSARSTIIIDGIPHQMVVTPVMAPDLTAWLCISFKLSQIQVDELRQLTQSHISLLLIRPEKPPVLITSSLPEVNRNHLVTAELNFNQLHQNTVSLRLNNTEYITSVLNLSSTQDGVVIAVLQKSLDEALKPFYRLQWFLFGIAMISLVLAFMGSLFIARLVSRPVKALVTGVRAVGQGSYDYRINVDRVDEIGELSHAFNDMAKQKGLQESYRQAKESAESASQAKTDFLANMSHELRTPLNSILGYAQLLKMQSFDPQRQAKALDIIEQSGQHLLNLINEILDLSKIEAGQLQLQLTDFNLRTLLDNIADIMRERAENKGLQLKIDYQFNASIGVNSDEQRLRQVLMNLLSNAIKYTESGQVTFKVTQMPTRHYRFCVEDTGMGIHSDHLDSIFTSFHQLHQSHCYIEGTGLGLAISKQLVALLRGELKVTSSLGSGSQFWFELGLEEVNPVVDTPATFSASSLIAQLKGSQQKILITDDKIDNRALLRDLLSPFGFSIHEAENGQDCIQQALSWKPDIILIDSKMPVMDGLEACKRIRACEVLKQTVIIAISANVFESHRQHCLEAGADDFIAKPIQLETLLAVLANHIGLQPDPAPDDMSSSLAIETQGILHYPDPDALQRLLTAAQQGDIQTLQQLTTDIQQQDQSCEGFLQQVSLLAEGFQMKKIRELLTQALIEVHK